MQLSIRKKIFIVILLPSLILLFLIYLEFRNVSALGRSAEHILANNYQSIKAAQQIRQLLEASRNDTLLALFWEQEGPERQIDQSADVELLLTVCQEHIAEAGEEWIVASLFQKFAAYKAASETLAGEAGRPDLPRLLAATSDFLAELDRLVLVNEQGMEKAEKETQALAKKSVRYSVGLLVFALLSTVLLSSLLSGRISEPLVRLAHSLARVKEGSGDYPHIPVTTHDEIGFLSNEFNRLFERLKAYDQLSAEQLMAEKRKVHRVEEAKTQFIADLSHQLKTPMTSLNMSMGLLTESADRLSPEKKTKLLLTAKEDCMRLSSLINELVDIARLDSMMKPRKRERIEIGRAIEDWVQPQRLQAEEKGVGLDLDIEAGMPRVLVDTFRFPWVITNLVGNAIRHTGPGGQVRVSVRRREERCYVECSDTGAGIAEEFLPRIFERYAQFAASEKMGGSGLGLAIVKEIVEEHGGEITVVSQLHRGTSFLLWIPSPPEIKHE